MFSRWMRTWVGNFLRPFLQLIEKLGVRPDALTIGGLIAEIIAGIFFAVDQRVWALCALLLGQVLDALDGELARLQDSATRFGAFLDSICDHYGDFAIYLGLVWQYLRTGAQLEVILVVAALFGSVFGSQVRSRASMAGIDTKEIGIFTRFERTLVIVIGVLVNQLTIALWVLAIFNNFSALQRIVYTVRAAQRNQKSEIASPKYGSPR